jgi:hypothetical protein
MYMSFDTANLMNKVGSAAPMIFAAWLFVSFLQNRYESAIDRYRELISTYRTSEPSDSRKSNMRDQVVSYRRRCELMRRAMSLGLASAIAMIVTLIFGGLNLTFKDLPLLGYLSAGCGLLGFILVIVATVLVIMEGTVTHRQIDNELLDVPDLAHSTGHEAGAITDPDRRGRGREVSRP